jgi:hypothetical protein
VGVTAVLIAGTVYPAAHLPPPYIFEDMWMAQVTEPETVEARHPPTPRICAPSSRSCVGISPTVRR